MVFNEKTLCYFLLDGKITDAEYTLKIPEKNWDAYKAIKAGTYHGETLYFECEESDLPISSQNIVPNNENGFTIYCQEQKMFAVRMKNGFMVANALSDPTYPGMSITFYPDNDDFEHILPETRMEFDENNNLHCYVWADSEDEEYTQKIKFK